MDPDRPIVRWSLMVLWVLVAILLYEPAVALFGWPLLFLAFAAGVGWTAQDFLAVRHQTERIRTHTTLLKLELAVIAAIAGLCVYLASAPSYMIRNEPHLDHGVGYGADRMLSHSFVPSVLAVLFVVTLRALHAPTPRRIAIVSLVALGVMPLLAAIPISLTTTFGPEETHVFAPAIVNGFSLCALAIGALGIHLGIVARRHGYGDDLPADPPTATLSV